MSSWFGLALQARMRLSNFRVERTLVPTNSQTVLV
jgi:hypothetical protein